MNEISTVTEGIVSDDAKVYYSYIPFNHVVNVDGEPVLEEASGADYLPDVMGLREDGQAIVDEIRDIIIENEGNTNTAVGSLWGWRSLRLADRGIFDGFSVAAHRHQSPAHPAAVGDDGALKTMVLMTDGINEFTVDLGFSWISAACEDHGCPPFPDPVADQDQMDLCDGINQEGILVYAIVLVEGLTPPQIANARNIFEKHCAVDSARYFQIENSNELQDAFREIAHSLINLRVTR